MSLGEGEIGEKYELLAKINEGGMGAIYKVRHRLLDEIRVVKVIRPQLATDAKNRERFQREAQTAIKLRHPNIAQIYDFSMDALGAAYLVMEFIEGFTLLEMLRQRGPLPVAQTLELAIPALEALEFLHQQGFVHRDISADNIMVCKSPQGGPRVKLIDLGLAKRIEGDQLGLTATGTFLGKVHYAAPEQYQGGKNLDHRVDLYAFGVLLYQLLTGYFPIDGTTVSELVAGHLFKPPRDFAQTDPDERIPPALRQVLLRALAKDPDLRIASAAELRVCLEPFAHPPSPSSPAAFARTVVLPAASVPAQSAVSPSTDPVAPDAAQPIKAQPITAQPSTAQLGTAQRGEPRPRRGSPLGLGLALVVALLAVGITLGLLFRRPSEPVTEKVATQEVPTQVRSEPVHEPAAAKPTVPTLPAPVAPITTDAGDAEEKATATATTALPTVFSPGPAAPRVPRPSGRLLLQALPWAEILALEEVGGKSLLGQLPQALPQAFTPTALELPAGRYRVRLAYGDSEQQLEVVVAAGQEARTRAVFEELATDAFFSEIGWPR